MELLYCGFNGFGQFPSDVSTVSHLTKYPLRGIKGVSLSWSYIAVLSESGIQVSGFVGGQSHQMKVLNLPDSQQPLMFSSSLKHLLVLASSGECWKYCNKSSLWKKLNHFAMVERDVASEPEDMEMDPILKVCCACTFDVVLSESGSAFVPPSPIYQPGLKVTEVACGKEHCLLLTETGKVFSWGTGSRGQLGHGDLESENVAAREIDMFGGLQVTRIAAGGWHSAAITTCGELFTWGWNNSGQLGFPMEEKHIAAEQDHADSNKEAEHGKVKRLKTDDTKSTDFVTILNIPMPVDWPSGHDVKDVSCGSRHTVVLQDDCTVWACGWNAYGQLGLSPEELQNTWKMRRLEFPNNCSKSVIKVECGAWSTAVFVEIED